MANPIFATCRFLAIVIAVVTVSYQAISAVKADLPPFHDPS